MKDKLAQAKMMDADRARMVQRLSEATDWFTRRELAVSIRAHDAQVAGLLGLDDAVEEIVEKAKGKTP